MLVRECVFAWRAVVQCRGGTSLAKSLEVRPMAWGQFARTVAASEERERRGSVASHTSRLLERGRIERGTVKVKRREYVIVRYEQTKLAMSRTV